LNPKEIFSIKEKREFERIALKIFRYQAFECKPYKEYLDNLGFNRENVSSLRDIPFLPVSIFKSREVITGNAPAEKVFSSSATTGMTPSLHHVTDLSLYNHSLSLGFRLRYGKASDYAIVALLPSYLEREGSSLVYMAEMLMKESGHPDNGFYLYNQKELYEKLVKIKKSGSKCILLGVSFALVDFATAFPLDFPELIVMETGGMKNTGRELSRQEIHNIICKGFGVKTVHSEYGMAELLSQAYSQGEGLFFPPPWMEVIIRDLNNPIRYLSSGKRGGINIIDLANLNSCSFIETGDMGVKTAGDSFEVHGRIKFSELRGCNLLLE